MPHCGNNAVYLHNLKLLEFSEIPLDEYHHLRVQSLFQSTCDKHPEKTLAITIISFFPRFHTISFDLFAKQRKNSTWTPPRSRFPGRRKSVTKQGCWHPIPALWVLLYSTFITRSSGQVMAGSHKKNMGTMCFFKDVSNGYWVMDQTTLLMSNWINLLKISKG